MARILGIDEIGNKYGRWKVISRAEKNSGKGVYWHCLCECGNSGIVCGRSLRHGHSRSCGCLQKDTVRRILSIDLTDLKFGKLIVIKQVDSDKGKAKWLCKCNCGKETIVTGNNLRSGTTKSCGCFRKERIELPEGEAAFNGLFSAMKHGAKNRKIEWALTKEQVRDITAKPCFYCGVMPAQISGAYRKNGNGGYIYNGIDRKDSSLGYTIENCVPCCGTCNKAKLCRTVEEFKSWILKVYKYFI